MFGKYWSFEEGLKILKTASPIPVGAANIPRDGIWPPMINATKNMKKKKESTSKHKTRIFTWFGEDVTLHGEIHSSLYEKSKIYMYEKRKIYIKLSSSSSHPRT